jgi:hypothetical protein
MSTPAGIGPSDQSAVGHTKGAWHTASAVRRPLAALLLVALAPVLAGCGDDDDERAFCDAAEAFDDRFAELDDAFGDGERAPGEVLDDMEAELEELAEAAPRALEDDFEAMTAAVRRLSRAVAEIDLDDPASFEGIADDLTAIDADLDRSSEGVAAHLHSECGIDIEENEE